MGGSLKAKENMGVGATEDYVRRRLILHHYFIIIAGGCSEFLSRELIIVFGHLKGG